MRIPLLAQCDSSISVCPATFDFLIAQNVKQQQCAVENSTLNVELVNLTYQLKETKSVLETTSAILLTTNEQKQTLQASIDLKDKEIKKKARQIIGLKVGIFTVGIVCVGSFTYLGIKQLLTH